MKSNNNDRQYWTILWLILYTLIVFSCGFVYGASLEVARAEELVKTSRIDFHICNLSFFEKGSERSKQIVCRFGDLLEIRKEKMTPERFEGADLYRFYIAQIHEQYYPDVDPYIVLAVLEMESRYVPNLSSPAGAIGLMQWIPKWHSWRMDKFHLNDPWDPYTNIIVGVDILNDAYKSTGSWDNALYVYNHSSSYVKAVLSKADILREGGYFA